MPLVHWDDGERAWKQAKTQGFGRVVDQRNVTQRNEKRMTDPQRIGDNVAEMP